MNIQGEKKFDASRGTVWQVLNDPFRMAKSMPGVESFDVKDDRHWTANVKVPLGLGALRMNVSMEKTEEREPEFAKMAIKGNGVGAVMNMQTSFHLANADAGTMMSWEADVHILGPVGSMGHWVLQPIVNQQVESVLAALDKQVQEGGGGVVTGESSGEMGDAGSDAPTPDRTSPETDPDPKDAEGPTTSTED